MKTNKKLIEVALPLDAVNAASAREKSIRHGHPSTLHLWWARRPLAAARAVIFAQMVDDPSAHPDLFPTEKKQEKERQRLFKIIEDLVQWENTTNEEVLERARAEIWQSWRRTCAENADHPRAKELFDRHKLPAFHDPFAGGGALPLEAQRLGLETYASDLNPVAVLINKAMIEIPPIFAGRPPVNSESRKDATLLNEKWRGAQGLAADVRHYTNLLRKHAEARIGHLYPAVQVTTDIAEDRPDLKRYLGQKLTVIAWIWARTVKSPNPAFRDVDVPLASTFVLSNKAGNEAYVEPMVDGRDYHFTVRAATPTNNAKNGTKLSRGANFRCLLSPGETLITPEYIRSEAKAGRMKARLMAIVAEGERGRIFLPPTSQQESIANEAVTTWKPDVEFFQQALGFRIGNYGMTKWSDLFSSRQLVALTTFADLVSDVSQQVKQDALAAGFDPSSPPLTEGGSGAQAYADAVATYLGLVVSKSADLASTICHWQPNPQHLKIAPTYARNALPMSWDYAEGNPFSESSGNFGRQGELISKVLDELPSAGTGHATQASATSPAPTPSAPVCSTDPPYFDNIGYADMSDFFYVWLRRALKSVHQEIFATLAVPKTEELVATPERHGGREGAESFFLNGMAKVMNRLSNEAHPAFPVTIYYAFKQAESDGDEGTASTGWETFLDAVIRAGFAISGTWPVRTERPGRMRDFGSNALASSIVLVCRPQRLNATATTRREFVNALRSELPAALAHLQRGNVAPVDLAQAAIGPGMAVYTRYSKVVDAEGKPLSVREALALINQTLDQALAEQEGDFDVDSRWALTWFDQYAFGDGPYGEAEVLATAKATSVGGLVESGILTSRGGKVRLLAPGELPTDWDPEDDRRTNVWEMLHHLIRVFEHAGEASTSQLLAKCGANADVVRELAYRLYTACERKRRAKEATSYNALVQSWPEIARLAKELPASALQQQTVLFDQE